MTSNHLRSIINLFLAFFACLVLSANSYANNFNHSIASEWFETKQNKVRLISATRGMGGKKEVQLGLQFKLKDNWKIYWKAPGDAGFPPRLNWEDSSNLKNTKFHWPVPTRFEVLGLQTIGYKKEVVFPILATVQNPNQPLLLRVQLSYLTCDDVCIPYNTNLSLNLLPKNSGPTEHLNLIGNYISRVPTNGASQGLTIERVETAGRLKNVGNDTR